MNSFNYEDCIQELLSKLLCFTFTISFYFTFPVSSFCHANHLNFEISMLASPDTHSVCACVQTYLRDLVTPVYEHKGWDEEGDESIYQQ